jgi:hypothetical protein
MVDITKLRKNYEMFFQIPNYLFPNNETLA